MSDEPLPLVRPYALTRGRTKPVRDYPIEALVSAVAVSSGTPRSPEEKAILGVCRESRSVAEVAALVRLPLGVVRVLVADLVERGLVSVHTGTPEAGKDIRLLERVLSGLRKL
jgi:hypothetical protein